MAKKKESTKQSENGMLDGVPLLGRPGNNLSMGLVGLPNVGKSSLFNLLTKQHVEVANRPFATIDPTTARSPVPDERFDWLCQFQKPKNTIQAYLEVTDIAGLVKGASQGLGLGNAFLSHISSIDGVFHLCRLFDDDDVIHVEDTVDPVRDMEIIHFELLAKDLQAMEKAMDAAEKKLKGVKGGVAGKQAQWLVDLYQRVIDLLNDGKPVRFEDWDHKEVYEINLLHLLSAKPAVYLFNLSKKDFRKRKNKWFAPMMEWIKEHGGGPIVPFSVPFEEEYFHADEAGKKALEEKYKSGSVLPKILHTGYSGLGLQHYFTIGPLEVRAWTVRKNATAPSAAGVIHSDLMDTFIKAEIMAFDDFKKYEGEAGVKAAGCYRTEGKTYLVKDGDIILFRSGAGKRR